MHVLLSILLCVNSKITINISLINYTLIFDCWKINKTIINDGYSEVLLVSLNVYTNMTGNQEI